MFIAILSFKLDTTLLQIVSPDVDIRRNTEPCNTQAFMLSTRWDSSLFLMSVFAKRLRFGPRVSGDRKNDIAPEQARNLWSIVMSFTVCFGISKVANPIIT